MTLYETVKRNDKTLSQSVATRSMIPEHTGADAQRPESVAKELGKHETSRLAVSSNITDKGERNIDI